MTRHLGGRRRGRGYHTETLLLFQSLPSSNADRALLGMLEFDERDDSRYSDDEELDDPELERHIKLSPAVRVCIDSYGEFISPAVVPDTACS